MAESALEQQTPGLRKTLTSPEAALESHSGLGVGVYVRDSQGRVLVIKEHVEKRATNRFREQFGLVCETLQPGETYPRAVIRGLSEELGIPIERISEIFSIAPETAFAGEGLVSNWYSRIYEVQFNGSESDLPGSLDGEVSIDSWRTVEELARAKNLREATRIILDAYMPSAIVPTSETHIPLTEANLAFAEVQSIPHA